MNAITAPIDGAMFSVMDGVFASEGDTSALLYANLLAIRGQIGAAAASDPWQNAEYVGATVTSQSGGSATGYAANGAAHPNNPKRWTTTPLEILWDGGLDATTGTNYHDALTGMVSAGQVNRCYNRASVPACSTQKIAIRLLGTGSPIVLIQLGDKFIAKAGHALAGSSGIQWLFVDRGASFDANERISVWSTGGIDGFYPETGGVITPEPAPWTAKSIVFNGDSITDGGGPTLVYMGYAPQVAWRLGFPKCIPNGVTGTGYLADSGGSLYYTVGQRVPNMTGASNGEMIVAGATNNPGMLLGCFVAGVNDLISGFTDAQVGAACRAAIAQFQRDAPGVPLIVFDSWDRNAPSAPESGYTAQSAAIAAACAGFSGVKFKSLQGLSYSKIDASHPDDAGALQQVNGMVPLISAAIDEMLLDPDLLLWRDAVVTNGGTVSAARLTIVNDFIRAEKACGAWALTDDYWALWGENEAQALTSLKQRRLASTVNSPIFTADRQYDFDGITNYINTGFIPSTHGVSYTGGNQRLAVYERTNVGVSAYTAGTRVGTASSIALVARGSTSMTALLNNTAGSGSFVLSVADSRGLKAVSRAGGTTALGYERGVRLTDVTGLTIGGSSGPSVSLAIGCLNSGGTPVSFRAASVGFVAIGGPLSDAQEAAQQTNVQQMATAIGANV